VKGPELAVIRASVWSLQRLISAAMVVSAAQFSGLKITFPGNGDRQSQILGSNTGDDSRFLKFLLRSAERSRRGTTGNTDDPLDATSISYLRAQANANGKIGVIGRTGNLRVAVA